MTQANDAAFATPASKYDGRDFEGTDGLTKREYFAAMALTGLLSNTGMSDSLTKLMEEDKIEMHTSPKVYSVLAIDLADALIEQLNKGRE